ncbi:MAG TPA: threonine/serine dehydratase [Bryobacteraceae bacterium]|nr:threonine/serine dehydratase [Bryobacteraceae bacterium]
MNRAAIARAAALIAPYIRRTPVIEVDGADFGLPGHRLAFKLELLQHAGSFKTRGAFSNLLTRSVPAAGVIAASGGNHGAAVAYAAQRMGKPATIFVPSVSSEAKMARIRGYGANLVVSGDRYADALAESERFAAQTGGLPIHAYDQPETLMGTGTVGLEFEAQDPALDSLLVAVGGGGLIGGMAGWYEGRVRLIGVEPEAAPTLTRALEAGHPVDAEAGGIAADSLAPKRVGALMFPLAQRFVEQVVLVEDDHIRQAQERLWEVLRVATEPGGAAAFAALLSGRYRPRSGERIGVLICGGNSTAVKFE